MRTQLEYTSDGLLVSYFLLISDGIAQSDKKCVTHQLKLIKLAMTPICPVCSLVVPRAPVIKEQPLSWITTPSLEALDSGKVPFVA